jgi:membrane protein insertase Oxa1/YidC/SpoIIIJ
VSFAIGVIIFLIQAYVFSSLYHLAYFASGQLGSDFFSGAFFARIGAILLIIAGAVMFFIGRSREKVSPSAGP